MTCPRCHDIKERTDIPHIIRTCEGCGRKMHVYEPGEYRKGIRIQEGEQFVIPKDWLKLSLNPLKSTGQLTRYGLQWFAQKVLVDQLPEKRGDIKAELERIEASCDITLKNSPFLKGLDIENPDHSEQICQILMERKDTVEWWTFLVGIFLSFVKDALEKGDIEQAIWGTACAERCRTMTVYKEHLEEVVWMGHSAKRIVDVLRTWDSNKTNDAEEFWQITFTENSYVISQVFAVPIVFIRDKAYVGGMNIDRKEAKFVDYLLSTESSREAILVEIKTPQTQLLGSKYRGVYKPSAKLAGSVVQVLDYRAELAKNLRNITEGTTYDISLFNPRCVVIAGNGIEELRNEGQRKSFELFRTGLKDVDIVTYDELFRKVEILANLFNLIRSKATAPA